MKLKRNMVRKSCRFSIFCSVVFVIYCLKSAAAEEYSVNCTVFEKPGKGVIAVPFETKCDVYYYHISSKEESSIQSISLSLNGPPISENEIVIITLNESLKEPESDQSEALIIQWNLTEISSTKNLIYYSRTSNVILSVSASGDWSERHLNIIHEELPLVTLNRSTSDVAGTITPWIKAKGRNYRPNSAYVFQINKAKKMKVGSIDFTLNHLDLDGERGEYLLIGAGTPLNGRSPRFITSALKKNYKVNDENAYFIFFSTSSPSQLKGFNISWYQNGTEISDEKDKRDDVLQSETVCLYNISAVKSEFKNSDPFIKFKKKLAQISNEYAELHHLDKTVNETQVSIFRISGVIQSEDLQEGAYFASVKIQGNDNGTAAFWRHQLKQIFNIYASTHPEETDGYRVGQCPPARSPSNSKNSIGIYVIIPVLCCLFLFIWTWNYNPLNKMLNKTAGRFTRAQLVSTEENLYSNAPQNNSIPRVHITSDFGRRYTLNFEQLAMTCAEEDSDVEIFSRIDCSRPRRSGESESANSSIRSSKRGEMNKAFEDDDCILSPETPAPEMTGTTIQASDHVYYSLESLKSNNKLHTANNTKL